MTRHARYAVLAATLPLLMGNTGCPWTGISRPPVLVSLSNYSIDNVTGLAVGMDPFFADNFGRGEASMINAVTGLDAAVIGDWASFNSALFHPADQGPGGAVFASGKFVKFSTVTAAGSISVMATPSMVSVPEPSTGTLFGFGLILVALGAARGALIGPA